MHGGGVEFYRTKPKRDGTGLLNSVVQWPRFFFPFLLVAAPLKWSSQKRVPFFSRVTEQLS